jgi:hypothetical protein
MATDGTGLKVIVPKLHVAHNGHLELYRNDELAVFHYEPDKTGDVVAAKLRPFHDALTADAERRFNAVFASRRVREAGCNAHGRRKFRDAEATQPVLAAEGTRSFARCSVKKRTPRVAPCTPQPIAGLCRAPAERRFTKISAKIVTSLMMTVT